MGRDSGRFWEQETMIRPIIETYECGAITIHRLFREPQEPSREIIDVEYEDISDQIEKDHLLASNSNNDNQLLITSKEYADTDNE